MATIVTRSGKGSPLTHAEVDSNFTNLNTDKLELSGGTMTGNLSFGDNDKAIFGAGSDLQIFHDPDASSGEGSVGSYIKEGGTGDLRIRASNLQLQSSGGERYMTGTENGAATLFYDDASKLATTSTGVNITGTLTSDGLTVEAAIAQLELIDTGASGSTKLRTANAQAWLEIDPDNVQASSGFRTYIDGKQFFQITDNGDISFYEDTGTTAKFFWDASAESLGIGTSSPSYAIDTLSSGAVVAQFKRDATGGASGGIRLGNNDKQFTLYGDNSNGLTIYDDATERMRIDSSGNVGIGTSSPSAALDVLNGSGDGEVAVFSGTDSDRGLSISTFAVGGFGQVGVDLNAQYSSSPTMTLSTGGTERMRIDSSGNLLVGLSSTEAVGTNAGTQLRADGLVYAAATSDAHILSRRSTDGAILNFRKDTTTVGSIGAVGSDIYVGTTDTNLRFADNLPSVIPVGTAGATRDATINLGSSGNRFKDLYLSGGLRGDTLTFSNLAGSERMRIDSSGQVGIGTSSPNNLLTLNSNTANTAMTIQSSDSGGAAVVFGDQSDFSRGRILYDNSDDSMAFETNNLSEAMRIDSSGNLLVGKTTADSGATAGIETNDNGRLNATRNGSIAGVFNRLTSDGDIMQFRKDGTTVGSIGVRANDNLYINSPHNGIEFTNTDFRPVDGNGDRLDGTTDIGDADNRFKDLYLSGGLRGDTTFKNNAGTTEYARFDSSGNLLVGKTSVGLSGEGSYFQADGAIVGTRDPSLTTDAVFYANRLVDDGNLFNFYKDGTSVGSIGSNGGDVYIGTGDTGVRFVDSLDCLLPLNTSTNATRDAAIDIGYNDGGRFKDLYLSGGVYLGGTGSANLLDDYEEGTWNATDGSGAGLTLTLQNNTYTKVGRLVTCAATVTWPTTSSTSAARLTLPFTSVTTNSQQGGVVIEQNYSSTTTLTAAINYTDGVIFRSRGYTSGLTNANLSGKKLRFILTYHEA